MKTQNTLGHNKRLELVQRIGLSATLFLGAFVVAFLAASSFAPTSDSSATDMKLANNIAGQYMNITSLGTIDINIAASPEGETSVGQDTLTIDTNVHSGYRIYISTPEDAEDTGLHHTDSSVTKKIPAASGTSAHPGKLGKNSWGYAMSRKLGTESTKSYTKSNVDPDDGEDVIAGVPDYDDVEMAYRNLNPTVDETNTVDIFYSVNADTSIPSGSYQTDVLYSAIVEDAEWNEASVAPANQKGIAAGQKLTIATDLYPGGANPDYGTITVKVGDNACTSPTPTITTAGNLNISCIAPAQTKAGKYDVVVSIENYHRNYKIKDGYEYIYEHIGILQNFDCFSIDIDEEVKLRDTRDDSVYRVKRLKDGNCWLMEDLHITGPRTLTPEDTDIAENSFTLGESDQTNWCQKNTAECYDQSKYLDATSDGFTVYYNWYTATAGTFPFIVSYTTWAGDMPTSGTASGSICPKGWHLPGGKNGGYDGELTGLTMAYQELPESNTQSLSDSGSGVGNPMELSASGTYSYSGGGNALKHYGSEYWTDTANGDQAFIAYYWPSSNPDDKDYFSNAAGRDNMRYHGRSVRCFAANTMSRFSCSDIPEIGGTKELLDFRNGTVYGVVKAKDGKCWTTKNQRLSSLDKSRRTSFYATMNKGISITIGPSRDDWCKPDQSCYIPSDDNVLDSPNSDYGTYYTWYTALAWGRNDETKTSGFSICPINWRAPSNEDWQGLYDSYGSVRALLDSPLNFEFAGYHLGSDTLKEGKESYFWSSSYEDNKNSYAFRISKTSYGIEKYNNYYGFNLRCVASN